MSARPGGVCKRGGRDSRLGMFAPSDPHLMAAHFDRAAHKHFGAPHLDHTFLDARPRVAQFDDAIRASSCFRSYRQAL